MDGPLDRDACNVRRLNIVATIGEGPAGVKRRFDSALECLGIALTL
jgi:hypothetical protein